MLGRVSLVVFVGATSLVHRQSALPDGRWAIGLSCLAMLCGICAAWALRTQRPIRYGWVLTTVLCVVGAGAAGIAHTSLRAQSRLDDALHSRHDNYVTRLTVQVISLPVGDVSRRQFDVRLVDDPSEPLHRATEFPKRIRVSWRAMPGAPPLPEVKPGQIWRMALRLRRPYGLRNPHAADAEARLFAQGIRATGSVRGRPQLRADVPWATMGVAAARARYLIRARMRAAMGDKPYAGVVIALAIGDQSSIPRAHWDVLRRTGLSHLVAISGMHIGLVAGLAAWAVGGCYRRARWRGIFCAEYVPAQHVMMVTAVLVAVLYCALSGWGIPARRVLLMLTLVAVAVGLRLPLSASRVLALAAAIVTLMDPWAPLSAGFWLSFVAVAVLLLMVQGTAREVARGRAPLPKALLGALFARPVWVQRPHPASDDLYATDVAPITRREAGLALLMRLGRHARKAAALQVKLNFALVPPVAGLIGQVSVAAPLVNAFAIPLIALAATPAALVFALGSALGVSPAIAAVWGAVTHAPIKLALDGAQVFAQATWAVWHVAAAPAGWVVLAALGVAWTLAPRGLPGKRQAWILVMPLLVWRPDALPDGEWRLTAMDVGQGGAVVIVTRRHLVVFDVGLQFENGQDMGESVVAPYVRALGRDKVDRLVVSHQHADHMGGMRGLIQQLPIGRVHAPFDVNAQLRRDAFVLHEGKMPRAWPLKFQQCAGGEEWTYDGVRFRFVHPPARHRYSRKQANASSCVLVVEGAFHRAVLPGDIGRREEAGLMQAVGAVDVALVAHHGSATSSSQAWVATLSAKHAIVQAGHFNRFGHPANQVVGRWRLAGARLWRTDTGGAIQVASSQKGLHVQAERMRNLRYWHNSCAAECPATGH